MTARPTTHAAATVALALLLAALGHGGPALGAHGGLTDGLAVDFIGMRPLDAADGPGACAVGGVVRNGSSQAVSVRLRYRAWHADGTALLATARVVRVMPGERRDFTSSPFARHDDGMTAPCNALRRVETLETVADPVR